MSSNGKERALDAGLRAYGSAWQPALWSRAPGRLELLGNHIDYNGGLVLAAAIDRDVYCLAGITSESGISVVFADLSPVSERFNWPALTDWTNPAHSLTSFDYVRGVIAAGLSRGAEVRNGLEISVAGDVPIGFGLSSSAALCVALTQLLHTPTPESRDLVLRAQEAEHRAGTPCGTMDQSASAGGNVILYDGSTVTWQSIVPDLGNYVFAVAGSGVARSLATSSYGRRVEESKQALALANGLLGRSCSDLAEINNAELDELMSSGIDKTLKSRIRHVVTETARVRHGIEAMNDGDWKRFGALMNESGVSSATDYEISHPAVEEIVAIAKKVQGVAGARMMGGGEGGTALILVERDCVDPLRSRLDAEFYSPRSMNAESAVRVFQFSRGASFGDYV